jgi:hypothetical protein
MTHAAIVIRWLVLAAILAALIAGGAYACDKKPNPRDYIPYEQAASLALTAQR